MPGEVDGLAHGAHPVSSIAGLSALGTILRDTVVQRQWLSVHSQAVSGL